jgi:hypothetical protein
VIISDSVARRFFAQQNPIGQRLLVKTWDPNITQMGKKTAREIVGVVGDVRQEDLKEKVPLQMYLPVDQNPISFMSVVVRTAGDPAALGPTVQREIAREDRDTPASDIKPMQVRVEEVLAASRQATELFGGFALVATILAVLGITVCCRTPSPAERTRSGSGWRWERAPRAFWRWCCGNRCGWPPGGGAGDGGGDRLPAFAAVAAIRHAGRRSVDADQSSAASC